MSRNASELDSASLHKVGVAKLPKMLKPETIGEETFARNRWAPRGDWRRRAGKERLRNLRGPGTVEDTAWESDDPIVAGKGLIHLEPRGSTVNMQLSRNDAAA